MPQRISGSGPPVKVQMAKENPLDMLLGKKAKWRQNEGQEAKQCNRELKTRGELKYDGMKSNLERRAA